MDVIAILAVVMLLAFLVESFTEYVFGQIFEHIPRFKPYAWTLMYIAMLIGIIGAFVYRIDLIHLLSKFLTSESPVNLIIPIHPMGMILTGLAIGRGSNFIHDLISRFFGKSAPPSN